MPRPRFFAHNLVPALASFCLLAGQARSYCIRTFSEAPLALGSRPIPALSQSGIGATIIVPFHDLGAFARRTGQALKSTSVLLNQMKELAQKAADGTTTTCQRIILNKGYQVKLRALRQVTSQAHFKSNFVLDGSVDAQLSGPDGSGIVVDIDLPDLTIMGIFIGDRSQLNGSFVSAMELTKVCAGLALSLQTQRVLNDAIHVLNAESRRQE